MKTTHWTFFNGSGLTNVATDMAAAEKQLGIDSTLCDTFDPASWEVGMNADVHVVHSHIPDELAFNGNTKMVVIQHLSLIHI